MGDNKKFYWLKIKEDWFEDDTIDWIEEQPNGEKYSLFYIKLCLKSLRSNGVLIRVVGDVLVPYDAPKLAQMTKTDVDTVVVAMELFKKIGLIQILENGEIYLTQLNEMVGSETDKAILMRKKRALEKLNGNNVTELLPNSYLEIDKEKDKEIIDIDIEEEKEVEKKKKETFVSLIDDYTSNPLLASALKDFVEMRKKKKGYTTRALKLNLRTLSSLATDDDTKIAIVEQSIEGTWNSFYELKVKPKSKEIVPEWTKQEQETTKDSHLEELMKRYLMFKMANNQTEMDKIKGLYFDLTLKDIETDIKER
jgi:predicted phage replisome organizer